MKVLIISGGISSERKISLISAKEVKRALEKNGHQVKLFDLKLGLETLKKLIPDFNVAFPILHGEEGEGGSLQEFLLKQKIPYVGGNPKGFKEGWYKIPFKKFCDQNNIPTSPWKTIKTLGEVEKFGFPCVLKASAGGSSREVIILKSKKDLPQAKKLLKLSGEFLIEKFLQGVEITVGILDNKVLPVLEIVPPEGKWFDYRYKYSGETKEIPNAPSIIEKERKLAQKYALEIHQKLSLGSYSRSDFIVHQGIPYALEVNTIPGWTPESLFPKSARAAGFSFEELVEKLINLSL